VLFVSFSMSFFNVRENEMCDRLSNDISQTIFRWLIVSTLITISLFLLFYPNDSIIDDRILIEIENDSNVSSPSAELLRFVAQLNRSLFHDRNCRIEVFGGFEGVEQSYISGVLFRDIPSLCSCYLHYQPLNQFPLIKSNSLNVSRIVWCVLSCPIDVIQWCQNLTHRIYCQTSVILIDLLDEALHYNIDHYQYFAAVFRNYLRFDSGNYLTYLTEDLRKLSKKNESLDWNLVIEIMKQEWTKFNFDFYNISNQPNEHLLNQINQRIVKRILIDKEQIRFHQWTNLDEQIEESKGMNATVYWFPIGFTFNYLYDASRLSNGPLSQRNLLWSWMGSFKENERTDMLNRFLQNDSLAHFISQRGFFHRTDVNGTTFVFMEYTAYLTDTQFVPLPRGYSPEQYRSFEAIQSGAFPIVNHIWTQIDQQIHFQPLAYLNVLGYDPPTVNNFSNLPEKLLELSRLPAQLLDDWQSIMINRHEIIMNTLTRHFANVVCQTTKSVFQKK